MLASHLLPAVCEGTFPEGHGFVIFEIAAQIKALDVLAVDTTYRNLDSLL